VGETGAGEDAAEQAPTNGGDNNAGAEVGADAPVACITLSIDKIDSSNNDGRLAERSRKAFEADCSMISEAVDGLQLTFIDHQLKSMSTDFEKEVAPRELVALREEKIVAQEDYEDEPKPLNKPRSASFQESLESAMEEVRKDWKRQLDELDEKIAVARRNVRKKLDEYEEEKFKPLKLEARIEPGRTPERARRNGRDLRSGSSGDDVPTSHSILLH